MKMPARSSLTLELALIARVLNGSADAVEIDDLDDYVVYANDTWCLLFSRSRDEVAALRWDSSKYRAEDLADLKDSWEVCVQRKSSRGFLSTNGHANVREAAPYVRTCCADDECVVKAVRTIYRSVDDVPKE